ncbi:MAG TPA: glycosyl hydrolase family 8, partial [Bacteroidales bacterium]|nr:glycosyl hydrolase family 8 [Bacteroidales bacterium]
MKTRLLLLVLCSFAAQFVFAQGINSSSPKVPFGSRTSYPYGIMPTNLPTSGTYGKSQAAADAYTAWKTNLTETCSNGIRVKFDTQSETVSEGIAYGMLLAAYAADKTLFDGLWKYYLAQKNNNGVMNWKINGCSGVSGQNGATDAELDAAFALIIAAEQWPTATSPYNYRTEALYLIDKIRRFEIHPSTYQTLNGDMWGTANDCRNPSYMAPAYYREYAKVETAQASFWNSATSTSNSFLLSNRNSTTGLVSNWAGSNASPNNCNGPNEFGWDAIRNPWRMAMDYIWNGGTTATTASDICSKMSNWAKNDAANLKGPCAMNASSPASGQYKNGTFGMMGLCFMGTSGTTYQTALNTAYTNIVNLGNSEPYFSQTLRCVTLFMMTGNFW